MSRVVTGRVGSCRANTCASMAHPSTDATNAHLMCLQVMCPPPAPAVMRSKLTCMMLSGSVRPPCRAGDSQMLVGIAAANLTAAQPQHR